MKNLFEACKPRESVFDETKRDDTLDLSNLIDDSIDADSFFDETYITEGMQQLFDTAFKRFEGKSPSGLIKLTQSMGGGKTHNMVALGLLAKNKELRKKFYNETYNNEAIKVVSYTGRESDIPYGIWGEIARQLGKEDLFKDYYAPLKAPGQSAWINLLKDEPILILLDELPPYLEYARTIPTGTGTLADITTNALANLFNALGKAELQNVCLVVSDLQATYETGSGLIQKSFKNLDNEIGRSSINIEPVGTTSDDLYHILRKRLFETIGTEEEIHEIGLAYQDAVKEAKQMNYTNLSPEQAYTGIKDAYPFHPSIKDLFARFKENPGFQQTRGFIRLTRIMVKNLYSGEEPQAKSNYLLNAFDIDLNNSEMFSMIRSIKPKLTNAISHDIAQNGKAVAEEIDSVSVEKNSDMQDLSKLLLVSSLGDVTNVLLGLSLQEAIGILAKPGRSITEIRGALEEFKVKAWYLYADRDNRLFFKDVKNVNAELLSLVDTYSDEVAKQEIKNVLTEKFEPKLNDCYQEVEVFPAIDEIDLKQDRIMLILFEPNPSGIGLQKDLEEFYNNVKYKNRVMFLTGQRNSMNNLFEVSKQLKGIKSIIHRMKEEDKIAESDAQFQQAQDILIKVELNLLQTARESFITLYYPTVDGFDSSGFKMEFSNNNFDAEEQIRNVLIDVMKFDKDTQSDTFRRKFEARIFTTRQARWIDLKERVATNTAWPWHHQAALEELKSESLKKGIWVEEGGYLDKEPPAPETSVNVRETLRDEKTGEVTLKIIPQNGDKVYYEINGDATPGSSEVPDLNAFKTTELALSFLCVDSEGRHATGGVTHWENDVKLQYHTFDKGGKNFIELKATSPKINIKYTTDGSNPKNSGGIYEDVFEVPSGTKFVQAIAVHEELGILSDEISIPITETKFEIDKEIPLTLRHVLNASTTSEVYRTLESLRDVKANVSGVSLQVFEQGSSIQKNWLDLSFDNHAFHETQLFIDQLEELRSHFFKDKSVEISITIEKCFFEKGQDFEDWIAENRYSIETYKNGVSQ